MAPARNSRSSLWTVSYMLVAFAILSQIYSWADSIKSRWYIFNPTEMEALFNSALAKHPNSTANAIDYIVNTLQAQHGSHLISSSPFPDLASQSSGISPSSLQSNWMFNNAGGAMGSMYLIHASITEYLIIFGTPLGTEGHTGRHTADDYFHILEGEQWAAPAYSLAMERYPKGSVHHLHRGDAKQYKMHRGCWALELAQGWIPLMLPFGYADGLFSTLDLPTLWRTTWVTGKKIVVCLLNGKI